MDGLLSIVVAVTLPLLVGAHILLFSRGKRSLRVTIPYGIVSIAYLVLCFHALGSLYANQRDWILSPLQYGLTGIQLLGAYWWKLLWPLPLMGYHVFAPVTSLVDTRLWLAVLLLLAIAALGFRRDRLTAFGCRLGCLVAAARPELICSRPQRICRALLYIPSAGFCLLVVWVASEVLPIWAGTIILAVVLLFYSSEAAAQSPVWKDDMSFFSRSLEQSPNSAFLHNMVANLLRAQNADPKDVAPHYTEAITLAQQWNPPENLQISVAYVGLANIAAESGSELIGNYRLAKRPRLP